MQPLLVSLLLLSTAAPTTHVENARIQPAAKVLILGTYHMDNPGLDMINPPADDVLTEARQAEIASVIARLKEFEPTHVAVERTPDGQAGLDAGYRKYLEASGSPERDEIYQIAFPLAAEMGHERLYGIDHRQPLEMSAVLEYAREHQPDIARRFDRTVEEVRALMDDLMKRPVPEILRTMNTPGQEIDHAFYLLCAQVGTSTEPIGADVTTDWHERNLKIFGNVARLAETGSERIVVLIGAGHAPLLRTFVDWAPNLSLVDTLEYLP